MKKKLVKFTSLITLVASYPVIAFAQGVPGPCGVFPGLNGIMCKISEILGYVLPVLVALGVVYFVWGVVQYVINDSDEAKKKGKDRMIFGIIGLAVIISLWGLVFILVDTFGTEGGAPAPGYFNGFLPTR